MGFLDGGRCLLLDGLDFLGLLDGLLFDLVHCSFPGGTGFGDLLGGSAQCFLICRLVFNDLLRLSIGRAFVRPIPLLSDVDKFSLPSCFRFGPRRLTSLFPLAVFPFNNGNLRLDFFVRVEDTLRPNPELADFQHSFLECRHDTVPQI